MRQQGKGICLLLIAALIWGSSFIVMKNAIVSLTPAVVLLIRFFIAGLVLSGLFFKQIRAFSRETMIGALLTGACLFCAYYVQTWGLAYTTPGKNAFLTASYCVIVPFLLWIFFRKKPDISHFIAAFLCLLGIGLLSLEGDFSISQGDFLTLASGCLYALHIIMLKKYTQNNHAGALTAVQFMSASFLAFCISIIYEDVTVIQYIDVSTFGQMFYLIFFATALTMLCQTAGQKYVSECQSSILLSLEAVFGVIFSVLFYGEVITLKILLGFLLMFTAILISELRPNFSKQVELDDQEVY